jgi:fructokinase
MKIGVDLGGTKIEIVALSADGVQLLRRRIPTPAGDYDATLDAIATLVAETERTLGRSESVGVGTPGAIHPSTGLLQNSNSVALNGRPLARDLARLLGREIRVANDANCLALSEAVDGAGKDASVVFAVILGTGVGGGISVDRRVVAGKNRIAGEWGHNPLPWMTPAERPGPQCYCGKRGCIETFLCGPALEREFERATGRALTAREIVEAVDKGDSHALGALAAYEDRLARGLAHVTNVLDPDVIVLGGGLSNVARLYADVPPLMQRYVFSKHLDVTIVPAFHGDSSGVRGAAWLYDFQTA